MFIITNAEICINNLSINQQIKQNKTKRKRTDGSVIIKDETH